jgi:hypothetical protein
MSGSFQAKARCVLHFISAHKWDGNELNAPTDSLPFWLQPTAYKQMQSGFSQKPNELKFQTT